MPGCILNLMLKRGNRFGAHLRKLRVQQGIGLRKLAMAIGISPTYLSLVEREEMPPPAERQVVALADALGQNRDVFLGIAGKVPSDLPVIIRKHPREYAALLRGLRRLREEDFPLLFDALVVEFKRWTGTPEEADRQIAEYKAMLERIDYKALVRSTTVEAKIGNRRIDLLLTNSASSRARLPKVPSQARRRKAATQVRLNQEQK